MSLALLGWFIAGICVTSFTILWFLISYQELSKKRQILESIREQVKMHSNLYMRERGGENDTVAHNVLESKLMVYRAVSKEYDKMIKHPMYHLPALIMGFHSSSTYNDV